MSKISLYYIDLVKLDAQRQRSEIRQFVLGFVFVAFVVTAVYLVRS